LHGLRVRTCAMGMHKTANTFHLHHILLIYANTTVALP
jgi:hypothetical protein